jgi:hypothetical protein
MAISAKLESRVPVSTASWIHSIGAFGHHGEAFRYVSLVRDVLGWVLERATDQRLKTLISEWSTPVVTSPLANSVNCQENIANSW